MGANGGGDEDDRRASNAKASVSSKDAGSVPVLPWMRLPVAFDAGSGVGLEAVSGMDPRLTAALRDQGIEELFPVQATVWRETAGGACDRHDICIAAPTGSGKTLAYALPLVSALAARPARALRGLVVLPTRDLAGQVFGVLAPLCAALGLGLGLAAGRAGGAAEAAMLASCAPDVLVATPGRLAGHVGATPGFGLGALRFLVVDECDRLLRQSYQGWLAATLGTGAARRVVKVVASATLTKDPAKLLKLGLHAPRFLAMATEAQRYSLPPSLKEFRHVVSAERKPEALAALLRALGPDAPTIVFTSSLETTARLQRLLAALGEGVTRGRSVEYSGALGPDRRRLALEAFCARRARILVCSDALTRGMDVAGVAAVVNYDAPVYAKTYVHRAGRTARAGAPGAVYTLLRREEVRHFRAMLRKAEGSRVADLALDRLALAEVAPAVEAALRRLQAGEDVAPDGREAGHAAACAKAARPQKRRRFATLPTLVPTPQGIAVA
ncbi:hypothetical protein ACKKBG_A06940 [Auxenochlorella protothecoides x Auxenochlorella symbiontica]